MSRADVEKDYNSLIKYLKKRFNKEFVLICSEYLKLLTKYKIKYRGIAHISTFGICDIYEDKYMCLLVDKKLNLKAICINIQSGKSLFKYEGKYDYKIVETYIKKFNNYLLKGKPCYTSSEI